MPDIAEASPLAHTSIGDIAWSSVGHHVSASGTSMVEQVVMTATTTSVGPVVAAPKLTVAGVGVTVGAAAWWGSGHLVAVTLVGLAIIVALGALVDARTSRLPNRASGSAVLLVALSVPCVAFADSREVTDVAISAMLGVVYSGAPLLFAIWLVRPGAIGGGDWKMLGAIGAGIGLVLPFAALVMTTIVCLLQIAVGVIRRTKVMAFGPSIAAGYVAAVLLLPLLVGTFGGPYL